MLHRINGYTFRTTRVFFTVFLTLLLSGMTNGQNALLDSLKLVLENTTDQKEQLILLYNLSKNTTFIDKEQSKKYTAMYDSIAHLVGEEYFLGQSSHLKARNHFAEEEYDQALARFLDALKVSESLQDTGQIASLNNNLMAIFWAQSDTINTLKYGQTALKYYGLLNNTRKLALGHSNLGGIYIDLQDFDAANYHLTKATEYCNQAKLRSFSITPLYLLAKTKFKLGEPQEALHLLDSTIAKINPETQPKDLARSYTYKGFVLTDIEQFPEAKKYLQLSQDIIDQYDFVEPKRKMPYYWMTYYEKKGDFKKALAYSKEYYDLGIDIRNQERDDKITELAAKYETEKKEAEIERLSLVDQLNQAQISNQRFALIGSVLGLGIMAFLMLRLFRQKHKIESQNAVISKALNEKDILLREIHHRVKNNLQLISSLLGLQSLHIKDPSALQALNSGKSRVKSMALIHQNLYQKENLTGVSVREYLEKLSSELISSFEVDTDRIKLQMDVPEILLDVDTLVPLGLIINELLTNSLKYAFPSDRSGQINIRLFEEDGRLRLEFRDDGIGIDLKKHSGDSFGYKLINTLLEQLEGEMEIDNQIGTELSFTFSEYKIAA